jgi:hypothetical protein
MSWWFARSLASSTWPVTEIKNLYSQLKYIDWQFLAKRWRVQIVWRAIQAGPSVLRTDYMPWIYRHTWNSGVELSLSKQAQALLQLLLGWFWHGYNHYVLKPEHQYLARWIASTYTLVPAGKITFVNSISSLIMGA